MRSKVAVCLARSNSSTYCPFESLRGPEYVYLLFFSPSVSVIFTEQLSLPLGLSFVFLEPLDSLGL